MDKAAIIAQFIAALGEELEGFARSARAAQAEATDEQSKAENKYDTRGLEASYLARGQSRQAAETASALRQFQGLAAEPVPAGGAVVVGALVEIALGVETDLYFIGPCAGGTRIEHAGREILVLSPASPLGALLMGRRAGDRLRLDERRPPLLLKSVR